MADLVVWAGESEGCVGGGPVGGNGGISLVEELLTDFFQLIHASIKNIVPQEEEDGDEGGGGGGHSSEDKTLNDAKNAMLKKGPGLGGFMAVLTTMQSTVEKPRELEESSSESDPEGSEEDFVVHPEDYPVNLQLVYHLLVRYGN